MLPLPGFWPKALYTIQKMSIFFLHGFKPFVSGIVILALTSLFWTQCRSVLCVFTVRFTCGMPLLWQIDTLSEDPQCIVISSVNMRVYFVAQEPSCLVSNSKPSSLPGGFVFSRIRPMLWWTTHMYHEIPWEHQQQMLVQCVMVVDSSFRSVSSWVECVSPPAKVARIGRRWGWRWRWSRSCRDTTTSPLTSSRRPSIVYAGRGILTVHNSIQYFINA